MPANYNNSVWFYDFLTGLIFGETLFRAQVCLLNNIKPGNKILIAGGGTGKILEAISGVHHAGLNITYVDVSDRMIAASKKRNTGKNEVTFINAAIENSRLQDNFDVVITPFLLDNFTNENLQKIFARIDQLLLPGGLWLNTDFQLTGKRWQKIMAGSMLIFFRIICSIEAKKLPDILNCFSSNGYQVVEQKTFWGDFILSAAYQKQFSVATAEFVNQPS